ncbi:MAG: tripartite tricarboxylate transporter TctB family protein [Deltaproteobacteria bacterium]|nr:tripartite tricarboxylate transporter TctB family protein [Deltaproteobacteria bacterium]
MKNIRDMVMGVVLILFAALIYGLTLKLPGSPSPEGLTPASFPRVLAIIIGCLSTLLIIKGVLGKDDEKAGPTVGPLFKKMVIFFFVIMSYIWLMPRIGYAVSTFSFLMISVSLIMPRRSARDFLKGFGFAFFATAFVYLIFGIFLRVPLIEGPVDLFLRYRIFAPLGVG